MPTDTKAGAKAFASSTFTGLNIDPKIIKIDKGFNARNFESHENQEHVRGLADSIKAMGVQSPLIVRFKDGEFFLVDGESRLRAVKLLLKEGVEIKSVPAVQEQKNTSEETRVASLLSHNSGKRLNQIEQGEVFTRLKNYGWSDLEIAAKTGISTAHVSNIMLLSAAPPAVKKQIVEGKVSSTLAIQTMREHGDKAPDVLKDAVKNAEASGKDKATAKHVTALAPAKRTRKSNNANPLALTRTQAKQMLAGLTDIYFNIKTQELTAGQVQTICRNIFEDVLGKQWKEIALEFHNEVNAE